MTNLVSNNFPIEQEGSKNPTQFFLEVYEQIHARAEQVAKQYNNNLIIKNEDIIELHHKNIQTINSLHPITPIIEKFVVTHLEGETESFNSFEEFQRRNLSSPNPTLDVNLIYRFTCLSPSKAIESFKIENKLTSRLAEFTEFSKQAPAFINNAVFSSIKTNVAGIRIEYSDYVKARNFISMFEEWMRGCQEEHDSKITNFFKSKSHIIPQVFPLIIIILLTDPHKPLSHINHLAY